MLDRLTLMSKSSKRERLLTGLSIAVYLVGWFLISSRPEVAAMIFVAAGAILILSTPTDASGRKPLFEQNLVAAAACVLPALGMCWSKYQDLGETRRWNSYLSQHQCRYREQVVTGYSKGGCDRSGDCQPGEEIEEPEYFCMTTKKRITFSGFREGNFGK
jgi:hypothetical protein